MYVADSFMIVGDIFWFMSHKLYNSKGTKVIIYYRDMEHMMMMFLHNAVTQVEMESGSTSQDFDRANQNRRPKNQGNQRRQQRLRQQKKLREDRRRKQELMKQQREEERQRQIQRQQEAQKAEEERRAKAFEEEVRRQKEIDERRRQEQEQRRVAEQERRRQQEERQKQQELQDQEALRYISFTFCFLLWCIIRFGSTIMRSTPSLTLIHFVFTLN